MMDIAQFRGMELGIFADSYVRAAYGKLSLQDRLIDGEHICCMFDHYANKCTIYDLRPSQCRTFPYWKSYKEEYMDLVDYCPGIVIKE